jgi:hypothetical protein
VKLEAFEADIVLSRLEAKKIKRGAPTMLTDIHGWIATDYWWTLKTGGKSVTKVVRKRWGVSEQTVQKYARLHKAAAMKFVCKAQAESVTRPKWAVDQLIKTIADAFQELGQESMNKKATE